MRDLVQPTPKGQWRSVCVASDGSYGVPAGLISSFPVVAGEQGRWTIAQGLKLGSFLKQKLAASVAELESERDVVKDLLG